MSDQYGKNSYFKVISGDVEDTMSVENVRTGDAEKLGNMFFPKGKDNTKTSKICCGDIGVFTKLASVKTGDTLGLAGKTVTIAPMKYDEPMYKMAIYAKVKGTEDKIAAGLVKLNEEDASFTYGNDPETKELILSGAGDMQLSVLMAKAPEQVQGRGCSQARQDRVPRDHQEEGRDPRPSSQEVRWSRSVRRCLHPLRAAVRIRRDDLRGRDRRRLRAEELHPVG